MGWLIALAVIVCIAIVPLGVSAIYENSGASVRIIAGPLRFTVYPGKKKEKKSKPAKVAQKQNTAAPQKTGGKLTDFMPLVRVVLDFLTDFRHKLRVDLMELKLTLAGGDPSDLAINYGKTWAAIGNLIPQLDRFFVVKKRDVQVNCDFTSDETLIYARLDLTVTVGRLFALGLRHGLRGLRELKKIMKLRKGGAIQ